MHLTQALGYSGVAIYTRSSKCSPIRAEEGITGVLTPPSSTTKFRDLPEDRQIGGYPRPGQLAGNIDEPTLDSEGRCVILEFPAFVLIGVYSPATRDETRTEFRQAFQDALDVRVRNLAAMGKQVVLCGDLNIIRSELDSAGLVEQIRKDSVSLDEYFSTPSRRFFNQLVFGGRVIGERDEGREEPVLWDLGREFHPTRTGMYTCWDTRKNARPGNFGSRIDYVLCTPGIKPWFIDSNIQEGLLGSDHCPVFAVLADVVSIGGVETHLVDIMNPVGMFKDGKRLREWSSKDLLPTSAKLIPEFNNRRSIRDMFKKATPAAKPPISQNTAASTEPDAKVEESNPTSSTQSSSQVSASSQASPQKPILPKRPSDASVASSRPQKKNKAVVANDSTKPGSGFSQSSLRGFLKPKVATRSLDKETDGCNDDLSARGETVRQSADTSPQSQEQTKPPLQDTDLEANSDVSKTDASLSDKVFDPIVSKETWSKLLGKRKVPKCEHGDDCQTLTTKKPGVNCGRPHISPCLS